jgi:hypothetical protein
LAGQERDDEDGGCEESASEHFAIIKSWVRSEKNEWAVGALEEVL